MSKRLPSEPTTPQPDYAPEQQWERDAEAQNWEIRQRQMHDDANRRSRTWPDPEIGRQE